MANGSAGLLRSLLLFAMLIAALAAIKYVIDASPDMFRSTAQAAVFSWQAIAIFAALGAFGTWLAHRIGLPGMWNAEAAPSVTLGWPILIGVALGIVAIVVDQQTGWTAIVAAKMKLPSIHIAFPASAIIYPGGAIIVGIVYLLLPIPLITWLVSSLLLRGGGRETTLWVMSALAAAIEPITQDAPVPELSAPVNTLLFVLDYVLNLAQARLFVTVGFVPAVLLRVAFYGVWHVAWGYVQGV